MKRNEIVAIILARLETDKDQLISDWNSPQGTKTHHVVIDDLLPSDLAERAYAAFPKDGDGFFNKATFREKKRTSAQLDSYDPLLGEITYAMQDKVVVAKIAEITGIRSLEPDPLLYAGGLSMMFKGDFLNPHLDNSHDLKRDRYRRLNLLYYVSPDWSFEAGGNFELWDEARKVPKTLISMRNRLVIMETNRLSWHSVSPVVADHPRCCVSNYYFSEESPDGEEYFHVTSFSGRPGETLKTVIGVADNALRQAVSTTLKRGRGAELVNKDAPKT